MSPLHLHENLPKVDAKALPSSDGQQTASKKLQVKDWTCLILSLDNVRREQLRSMVHFSGWRPLACSSVAQALQQVERLETQFALVDLAPDTDGQRESVFRLVERLSDRAEPLVMVCDDEPCPEAELWARKLGVWLYLPEPQIGEELVELCQQALQISRSRSTGGLPEPSNTEA